MTPPSREDRESAVTVHTLGVHYRWVLPAVVESQLLLAHQAREDMVALELELDRELKTIWSSYPVVAAVEADLSTREARLAALSEQAQAHRAEHGSRRVDETLAAQLRDARLAVKSARQARRDAIGVVTAQSEPQRRALMERIDAERKALYRKYCVEKGLYWGTFNDVATQHRVAVQRVKRQRREGRPATLRHHRFDGTGTLTVQIQRRAAPRSPEVLADPSGRYAYFVVLPWIDPADWDAMSSAQRRAAGRVTVRLRVGSLDGEPQWVQIPVQAHRWLPSAAEITHVRLTVRRTAARRTAQVLVTAHVPQSFSPAAELPAMAVHLGWRATEAGVQVASWRSTAALAVPSELQSVMVCDPGAMTGRIMVPRRTIERLGHVKQIEGQRAQALAEIREEVAIWLAEHGPVQYQDRPLAAEQVRQWRSAAQFAALARDWRNRAGLDPLAARLEAWRRVDVRGWDRQAHGRRRALGHRDDVYRQIAAAVTAQVRCVVVDDMNLTDLARISRADAAFTGLRHSADRRVLAAPGKLRDAITSAARRAGIGYEAVSPKGLGRIHADCGHENPADGRYVSAAVRCDGCGAIYEVDDSTTMLMLRQAGAM